MKGVYVQVIFGAQQETTWIDINVTAGDATEW